MSQHNIVTRDSLQEMVNREDRKYVETVIGRALWAIFQRQTESERKTNDAKVLNNIGFSGADARRGSLTAKYWKKHGNLQDWQLEYWREPLKNGYSRICKYARQLNEIALEKAQNNHEKQ